MQKQRFQHIPINELYHDPENSLAGRDEVHDLVASIGEIGLIHPLAVAKVKGQKGHMVVAGNRRLKALGTLARQQAGDWDFDSKVPCLVVPADANHAVLALVENRIRVDWTPIDEAVAFSKAHNEGASIADLAAIFAVSDRYVRQRLQLASLSEEWQALTRVGKVAIGVAACVAAMDQEDQAAFLAQNYNDVGRLSPWSVRRFVSARGEWHSVTGPVLFDWGDFAGEWRVDLFGDDPEGHGDGEPVYYVKDKAVFLAAQQSSLHHRGETELEERKAAVEGSPSHYPTWFVVELWSEESDSFAYADDVAGDEEEIDHERGMGLLYVLDDGRKLGHVDTYEVYAVLEPEAAAEALPVDPDPDEVVTGPPYRRELGHDPQTGEVDESLEADRRMLNGEDVPPWEDAPAGAAPPVQPVKVRPTFATATSIAELAPLVSSPLVMLFKHLKLARIIAQIPVGRMGLGAVLLPRLLGRIGDYNTFAKVSFDEGSSYGEPVAGVHDVIKPIIARFAPEMPLGAAVRNFSYGRSETLLTMNVHMRGMDDALALHTAVVVALLRWTDSDSETALDELAAELGIRMEGYIPGREVIERLQKAQIVEWAEAAQIAVDRQSKRAAVSDLAGALKRQAKAFLPPALLFLDDKRKPACLPAPAYDEISAEKALAAE